MSAFLDYSPDAHPGYDSHQSHSCENDQVLHIVTYTLIVMARQLSLSLTTRHAVQGSLQIFLTSTLHVGTGRLRVLAAFTPEKVFPCTHCIGSWVDPTAGLETKENSHLSCRESTLNFSVVQPECYWPCCLSYAGTYFSVFWILCESYTLWYT
jgi:hypothetical protein